MLESTLDQLMWWNKALPSFQATITVQCDNGELKTGREKYGILFYELLDLEGSTLFAKPHLAPLPMKSRFTHIRTK